MTLNAISITKINDVPRLGGLVMLVGAPGSGKSTFARQLISAQNLDEGAYISNDKIASDLFGITINRGDKDGEIFAEQDRRIAARLATERVAIVDATNVKIAARLRLISIARQYNSQVTAICFKRDKATLLRQNSMRQVVVPEAMVLEYAENMNETTPEVLFHEGVGLVIDVPLNLES
jgi:predicted kinase